MVLGMHRSGTSALGGVLSKLGCDVPASLMPASKGNEKGFFESVAVRDFNEELLASAGSSWDDFAPFHEDWMQSPTAQSFLDRAVGILRSEFGDSQLFVLKDPRICRLVPFWTAALERAGCAIKPILTIRNPLEVSHSLQAKKEYGEPLSQMIWLRHALDAEHASRGMRRFHTSFEQLMRGWESVAERAQAALGLVWPKPVAAVEFEMARFLSRDLRHHKEAEARAMTSSLLPEWLRQTYEVLNHWAEHGESSADYPKLDRIKEEFDLASHAFSRLVRAERDLSAEPRERASLLQDAVTNVRAELAEVRITQAALEASLKEAELVLNVERQKLSAEADQAALLRSQLESERGAREAFEREANEASTLRAALEREASEAHTQRAALERMLEQQQDSASTEIDALRAEVERWKGLLQDQRRQATLTDAEIYQLKEEREALGAELDASRARRKEMARVIAARDAVIQSRYEELAILERQMLQADFFGTLHKHWHRGGRWLTKRFGNARNQPANARS